MIALVDAKRDEYLEEFDAIDGRDLMNSEVTLVIKSCLPVFPRISGMIWLVRGSGTFFYLITAVLRITMLAWALMRRTIGY